MRDPIARKRLKKKMLDRWENEGGRIATDTPSADLSKATSEDKGNRRKPSSPRNNRKLSSPRDNLTVDTPASTTKKPKPASK